MAQSVTGTWDALYAAVTTMFAGQQGVLVSAGDPGNYQPDLIIAVMDVDAPITHPTAAPTRPQDERITIQVLISAFVGGGPEAQQIANQTAWAASDTIKNYFRTSPNEKLGGACYNSFVAHRKLTPEIAYETPDGMNTPVPVGRTATIDVTVAAWIRT
jgi:hypothetical protein